MDVFYTDSSPQLKAYAKTDVDKRISELEKQLAEARAENAALVAEFQRLADEPPTLEEIAADLDKIEMLEKELAEAQAEIERLALEIENQQYTITCASEENQQLKESLSEARAKIEQLNKREIDLYTAEVWAIARHAFMSGAFKGYEHGTEKRLRDQYFKEWCLKSYPEAVKAALKQSELIERLRARNEVLNAAIADMTEEQAALCAEGQSITELVAAKDRLIEQLKKALESAKRKHYVNDDDNWYSCPASGLCGNDSAGTDCNCGADYINSVIKAALSAAERMKKK